jgi:TRAP-type mannitol/chloroaromatic compound transport system permease small subunit
MDRVRGFLKGIDWINEQTGRLISFLCFFIMATVSFEVVARYIFNHPTIWALEINQYLLCGYSALAGGYAFLYKSHVTVDIVYQRINARTRALLDILTSFFCLSFLLVLIWTSSVMAWKAWKFDEHSESLLAFPLLPVKIVIPLGGLLILLQALAKLVRDLITVVTGVVEDRPGTKMFGIGRKEK